MVRLREVKAFPLICAPEMGICLQATALKGDHVHLRNSALPSPLILRSHRGWSPAYTPLSEHSHRETSGKTNLLQVGHLAPSADGRIYDVSPLHASGL